MTIALPITMNRSRNIGKTAKEHLKSGLLKCFGEVLRPNPSLKCVDGHTTRLTERKRLAKINGLAKFCLLA
jgi:hypothetical protein